MEGFALPAASAGLPVGGDEDGVGCRELCEKGACIRIGGDGFRRTEDHFAERGGQPFQFFVIHAVPFGENIVYLLNILSEKRGSVKFLRFSYCIPRKNCVK